MKLLVTGCAGFIGSHFTESVLGHADHVVGLDCLTYAGNMENIASIIGDPRFTFVVGDIRDKELVRTIFKRHEITHVAHLAAESHVDRSIAAPDLFIQTNITGTFNLLEAARLCWGQSHRGCFMHVSTDEVFGSIYEGSFTENSPYLPNSPYASSKAAADMLVRAYRHTYKLPAIITHSSNNYGPRQYPEKLIPMAIECLLEGKMIPIHGDGTNVRDWIHVQDNVAALIAVLTKGKAGQTYLIGANNTMSNREVVEQLCEIYDVVQGHPHMSSDSMSFVTDRPGNDYRYSVDSLKIRTELGWAPHVRMDVGLQYTIQWFMERHRSNQVLESGAA